MFVGGGLRGGGKGRVRLGPASLFSLLSPGSQHRILLDFLFLDTECTYDYLFGDVTVTPPAGPCWPV